MTAVMELPESDPIAQRLSDLLGDAQKDFEDEAFPFKLRGGSKYGGYGSFLPTLELRPPSLLAQIPAAPITSTPKNKSSSHAVLERIREIKAANLVTDAAHGNKCAVGKFSASPRLSLQNLNPNNTIDCTLDIGDDPMPAPTELAKSRGASGGSISALENISNETLDSHSYEDHNQMEQKEATLTAIHVEEDSEGNGGSKNKSFYYGFGLSDSSPLSTEDERENETYASDAYSTPDLSPLTMIQAVMSRLQPKYPLLLSPLPELFVSPTIQRNSMVASIKGSSNFLSPAEKIRQKSEESSEKDHSQSENKACEGRHKKKYLQVNGKMQLPEQKPASSDGSSEAQMESKKDNYIQKIDTNAPMYLHDTRKDLALMEKSGLNTVLDECSLGKDAIVSRDASEILMCNLDPSKQKTLKRPTNASRKEEGEGKQKGRTVACRSVEWKEGKEEYEDSTKENSSQIEFSNLNAFRVANLDLITAEENENFLSITSSKRAKKCKVSFQKNDIALTSKMANSSEGVVNEVIYSSARREMPLQHPAEEHCRDIPKMKESCSDIPKMKESSDDGSTNTFNGREGKKGPFKKAFKQSASKDIVNVAARELGHDLVAISSECHKTKQKNIPISLDDDKSIEKEFRRACKGGKHGNMLHKLVPKIMKICAAKKSNAEASFSNLDKTSLVVDTSEPVHAASGCPETFVVDNWVMCDKCGKWRLLLPEIDSKTLPKMFFCKMMTWLPGMNNCEYGEDETNNAVYEKLGIPNPNLVQLNASIIQLQPASVQTASSISALSASYNLRIVTDEPQETKIVTSSAAASSKKSLAGKLPPRFSKAPVSVSYLHVDDAHQDPDQAYLHTLEKSLSLLKFKRKPQNTATGEFESVIAVKKTNTKEGNLTSLKTFSSKGSSKISVLHESKKSESSAALLTSSKHWKKGTSEGDVECNRSIQSKTLADHGTDGSSFIAEGLDVENHNSIGGKAEVQRNSMPFLSREEHAKNEGKRLLREEVRPAKLNRNAYPSLYDGCGHQNPEKKHEHQGLCSGLQIKGINNMKKIQNWLCSEYGEGENLRERDEKDGQYDRHNKDDEIQKKDCCRDSDSEDRMHDNERFELISDGQKYRCTRLTKGQNSRDKFSSGGSQLNGMKDESKEVHFERSDGSDVSDNLKDAICDIKFNQMAAGKESYVEDLPKCYENNDNLHQTDGRLGFARQAKNSFKSVRLEKTAGSKEGEDIELRIADEPPKEPDVPEATGVKGQRTHKASFLIKKAKDLKHFADVYTGPEAARGDLYLHAAFKFLEGAAILETSQAGGTDSLKVALFYSDTAKLCELSARFYLQDIQATALILKCAAVARMREMAIRSLSASRNLAEIQATLQLTDPSPLGESPSSSASDVDNLNNQALPHEKLQPTNTVREISLTASQASILHSIPARHYPIMTSFLRDTRAICAAFKAWEIADSACAAARVACVDASFGEAIMKVGETGFSDVEVIVHQVSSAFQALRGANVNADLHY